VIFSLTSSPHRPIFQKPGQAVLMCEQKGKPIKPCHCTFLSLYRNTLKKAKTPEQTKQKEKPD